MVCTIRYIHVFPENYLHRSLLVPKCSNAHVTFLGYNHHPSFGTLPQEIPLSLDEMNMIALLDAWNDLNSRLRHLPLRSREPFQNPWLWWTDRKDNLPGRTVVPSLSPTSKSDRQALEGVWWAKGNIGPCKTIQSKHPQFDALNLQFLTCPGVRLLWGKIWSIKEVDSFDK